MYGYGNRTWQSLLDHDQRNDRDRGEAVEGAKDVDEPEEQRVAEATNETSIYEVTARMPCTCGA